MKPSSLYELDDSCSIAINSPLTYKTHLRDVKNNITLCLTAKTKYIHISVSDEYKILLNPTNPEWECEEYMQDKTNGTKVISYAKSRAQIT